MKLYESKEDTFSFEKKICLEHPELWQHESFNLFSAAQILLEFNNLNYQDIFTSDKKLSSLFTADLTGKVYWHYRIIRMLWGFGFENILKGIIIQQFKTSNPDLKEVPIKQINTHSLFRLFKQADVTLSDEDSFYIGILQKCTVWMGRYPMPLKHHEMYEKRTAMPTREALIKRSMTIYEKFQKGEIKRTVCESDILHSGIGNKEYNVVNNLKSICFDRFLQMINP